MKSLGIPEEEIPKFADANHWLKYFPPLTMVSPLFPLCCPPLRVCECFACHRSRPRFRYDMAFVLVFVPVYLARMSFC